MRKFSFAIFHATLTAFERRYLPASVPKVDEASADNVAPKKYFSL